MYHGFDTSGPGSNNCDCGATDCALYHFSPSYSSTTYWPMHQDAYDALMEGMRKLALHDQHMLMLREAWLLECHRPTPPLPRQPAPRKPQARARRSTQVRHHARQQLYRGRARWH